MVSPSLTDALKRLLPSPSPPLQKSASNTQTQSLSHHKHTLSPLSLSLSYTNTLPLSISPIGTTHPTRTQFEYLFYSPEYIEHLLPLSWFSLFLSLTPKHFLANCQKLQRNLWRNLRRCECVFCQIVGGCVRVSHKVCKRERKRTANKIDRLIQRLRKFERGREKFWEREREREREKEKLIEREMEKMKSNETEKERTSASESGRERGYPTERQRES